MKPHAPPLAKDTFVPRGGHDPLLHNTQDFFWYHIEPYFKPITEHDVNQLEPTRVETKPVPALGATSAKNDDLSPEDAVRARMLNYPLARRLMSAMIDEGRGAANAAKNKRAGLTEEDIWIGGTTPQSVQNFDHVLEERVKLELQQRNLLDPEADDDVLRDIRLGHWHLRNVVADNSNSKGEISRKAMPGIASQAARRTKKIGGDHAEIKYLESKMEKGGKRGKGRFAKLLNQMHPNRNLLPGDPVQGQSKPGSSAFGDKSISKKRKKKHSSSDRGALKNTEQNGTVGSDAGDNIAPQIAAIIWKHNNQAHIDEIVKEFIERVPHLAGDIKDARRRITNIISFSRKPFRFRKLADGVTYSATRV